MMVVIPFLIVVSSLLRGKASSQTCTKVTGIPQYKQVSEIDPPGTIIFNASKSATDNISYRIRNASQTVLQTYFREFQNDSLFIFYLNKTLDLEELYSLYPSSETTVDLIFSCDTVQITTRIIIEEENEFDPDVNISGSLDIPENTSVGTVVYNLLERTSDKDRPVSRTFYYTLADNMFRIDGASTGEIRLASPLDYDSGQRNYLLNISVKDTADNRARNSTVSLSINVTDIDDQGPRFEYPNCVAPCLIPEYTAITTLSFTGQLKIQPESIRAHDLDTLNFPIAYSFYDEISGKSSNIDSSGFFRIDQNSGSVLQIKPASGALWPTKRIVIMAQEVGSSQSAALAILMVRVLTRDPTINYTSVVPPDSSAPAESDKSLLTAVIVLSVLMGMILIAAVIVIILMQRKLRQKVSPDDTKSEPGTEEEEIHSERSEEDKNVWPKSVKTVDNDRSSLASNPSTDHMFLNIPLPSKSTLLEPLQLKDTRIANNNSTKKKKKKKKSRRFLKKKENEIFDGTAEYNMQEDPNFYASPDKSKIKRSTRSMKAPTEHIVVPNDNVEF